MAKGLRSKYKKRLRTARATHLYETKGITALAKQSAKLHDNNYSMAADHALPPNAFLHPTNPFAVFPQTRKPEYCDFRINRMKHGGLVAVGTFRKINNPNVKHSKYATITKTTEML